MSKNSDDNYNEKEELKLSRNNCCLSKLIEESIVGNLFSSFFKNNSFISFNF